MVYGERVCAAAGLLEVGVWAYEKTKMGTASRILNTGAEGEVGRRQGGDEGGNGGMEGGLGGERGGSGGIIGGSAGGEGLQLWKIGAARVAKRKRRRRKEEQGRLFFCLVLCL